MIETKSEIEVKTGAHWLKHEGKDLLFINYEGTNHEAEMIEIITKAKQMIIDHGKEYVQLTNMKNAFATSDFMKEAKKIAKETPKLAIKRAIVGVDSPARLILLKAYNFIIGNEGMKPFKDIEEAKQWLVS